MVVAAAITDDLLAPRRLLSARRNAPPALAGRWEFPGGKVEQGETPEEALLREIREELGVPLSLGDEVRGPAVMADGRTPVWELRPAGTAGPRLVMRVWWAVVTATGAEPQPLEDHDALAWLNPGSWRDVDWLTADEPIVEALISDAVERNRRAWC